MPGQIYFSLLNPAIAATFAVMFLLLWRRWPWQGHLALLALAFALGALGFVLVDLTPLENETANRLVSNGVFVVGVLAFCCAALQRIEVALPWRAFAAILVVGFGLYGWFLFVDPSLNARILVVGLILAGITGAAVQKLLAKRPLSTADRLLLIAALLSIVLALLRPALALTGVLQTADGPSYQQSSYWLTIQAFTPILLGTIALLFLAAMGLDIFERLGKEANHDYLTGLLNRRGFEAAINPVLDRAGHGAAALLVADIDNFKRINDTYGHKTGDQVIAAVAHVLARHSDGGPAARIGGEEFALFLAGGDIARLQEQAEAIRTAMRELAIAGLPPGQSLTLSIGLHQRGAGETLSDMLVEADRALYRAKAAGKDQAVLSPPHVRPARSA